MPKFAVSLTVEFGSQEQVDFFRNRLAAVFDYLPFPILSKLKTAITEEIAVGKQEICRLGPFSDIGQSDYHQRLIDEALAEPRTSPFRDAQGILSTTPIEQAIDEACEGDAEEAAENGEKPLTCLSCEGPLQDAQVICDACGAGQGEPDAESSIFDGDLAFDLAEGETEGEAERFAEEIEVGPGDDPAEEPSEELVITEPFDQEQEG